MQRIQYLTRLAMAGSWLLLAGLVQADGLSDLKSSLQRLTGQTPLKATLELKTWRRLGEGKEAEEESGLASLGLEDGARGLQLQYGKELLQRSEQEARASANGAKVKTPTLFALRELQHSELRRLSSAAGSLQRLLEQASFKGERADSFNGKPARLLSFSLNIEAVPERQRRYVKQFDSNIDIWIAADGSPLACRQREQASGRAFLVVRFESQQEDEWVYAIQGDRLLTVRHEHKRLASGAGEREEARITKTLQWAS